MSTQHFAPYQHLAGALLPHAVPNASDGSHDLAHILRVWTNVCEISKVEGGDAEVLTAATLLHDCVEVEKNSPLRSKASRLAAEAAASQLEALNWPSEKIARVQHAIEAHSFSAQIAPETLEARILQDADRLDAIGLIGVARCFYVAGRMGSTLYEPQDPQAKNRDLNDSAFAIDHFEVKLLKLAEGFQTETGQRLAQQRHEELLNFRDAFLKQIGAN